MQGHRDNWSPGDRAFFQYDCYRDHDSADAKAWYRSHQFVTVLGTTEPGGGGTLRERVEEAGMPRVYRVRFPDGWEYDAWEYELYDSPRWQTSDLAPPPLSEIATRDPDWAAFMRNQHDYN